MELSDLTRDERTALPDAMGEHESTMLEWPGKEWGIAVRIEESGSGDDA